MVATVVDILAGVFLILGSLLSLTAAVGLLRFPDVLSRLHAATKPQVLGLLFILIGAGLRLGAPADIGILLVIGAFQLITSPVAAHMVGRAAYRAGQIRADLLRVDELAPEYARPHADDDPIDGPAGRS